jgi:hypothetical protein
MTHDPFPREPLTPEEQALARRLAQLGPQAEPSSALDARILAAARAEETRAVNSARRSRPWPVALGVAASLVLAIGLAWRLRPLPEPVAERAASGPATAPAEASHQAAASSAQDTSAGETLPAFAAPPPRDSAPSAPQPSPATPVESQRARVPAAPAFAKPTPTPEPPVVLDAPATPVAATALPAPPPPAPPAPAMQSESRSAPARKAANEETPEEAGIDAAAAADQAGDEPERDVPPATADSPDVREAWLQRIRELLAAGQTDAARASLKEFVRRHPDAPLPDDLRALQR